MEEQILVFMDKSIGEATTNNDNIQQETQRAREDNSSTGETSLGQHKRVQMIALPDYIATTNGTNFSK